MDARFAVVSEDGRRSATWRIWTRTSGKPSDDTYLAPTSAGHRFKISLHADLSGQLGYDQANRERIRPGDRQAIDRWACAPERFPGWRIGLLLRFSDADLRLQSTSLDSNVVVLNGPTPPDSLVVQVWIGSGDSAPPADLDLDAQIKLRRSNTGSVLVYPSYIPLPDATEDARRLAANAFPWSPSVDVNLDGYSYAKGIFPDGTRIFSELLSNRIDSGLEPVRQLLGFSGQIGEWDDLPVAIREREDICAVLDVDTRHRAKIFVDNRARCDHRALGDEAQILLEAIKRGDVDERNWNTLPDGSKRTLISTPRLISTGHRVRDHARRARRP